MLDVAGGHARPLPSFAWRHWVPVHTSPSRETVINEQAIELQGLRHCRSHAVVKVKVSEATHSRQLH